jgi:hypothetical protein
VFLTQLANHGSRRQENAVANHFTPPAGVTARHLENAYLDQKVGDEIGRPWCSTPAPGAFRAVMNTRADRVGWAWSSYALSCGNAGCP